MKNISIKNLAVVAGGYGAVGAAIGAVVGSTCYVVERVATGDTFHYTELGVIASMGAAAGYLTGAFGAEL